MEFLTLILKWRLNLSESFRFHHYCDEMELINVCFAYDLFIFAKGDTNSARVIMEGLDEFKKVSGLVPSILKSTTFFCNVPSHVKLSILKILPFSEGKLPIKYLCVPLISSRLLIKDFKALVEQAKNLIRDRKNKSLSFGGRLQLCTFVISSMQVYWASVLLIPKVAWDVISLPKTEGGLDIRNLDVVNIAFMTKHTWNIISNRKSLWVSWTNTYKLRSRSFWEVPSRADSSWGWRKLLQLQDSVRPFFWTTLGNGVSMSLLFDYWCDYSPIARLLMSRDVANKGFSMTSPVLDAQRSDSVLWRNRGGVLSMFSVSKAWEELRPRGFEEAWDILAKTFDDNKQIRFIALKSELRSLKLGDMSIDACFLKIKSIANILASLDSPISKDDIVNISLDGLPDKFDMYCSSKKKIVLMASHDQQWYMDTGATSHLSSHTGNLQTSYLNRNFHSVIVGNGSSIHVTHSGHV
ncbi:hypothetical protein Tco_0566563 [Tanacetum coccineum]